MKIHTDTLTLADIHEAARVASALSGAPVYLTRADERGSRSHRRAFDVILASDGTLSRRRVNYGSARYADRFDRPYAATWDQWGWFLASLFAADPGAKCWAYYGADMFHAATGMRFTEYDGHAYSVRATLRPDTEPRRRYAA